MKRYFPLATLLAVLAMAGYSGWRFTALADAAPAQGLSKQAITDDPVAPKVAPKGYDLTIVEFQDYNCPYCRRSHAVVEALLASDRKIRFVYRDWPIFGAASVEAARAAIASKWQGKHAAFNTQLFSGSGKVDSAGIRAAANRAGVNWATLQADLIKHRVEIDALLARTDRQARALGLQGTPAFIIGAYLVPGALDLPGLRKAVAEARAHPGGKAP